LFDTARYKGVQKLHAPNKEPKNSKIGGMK